ncbi:hypothetical protein QTJ16_004409 [Diplocarpon rosae]|uniref:Uncharacterized protein n=1 Tax=Diplocarpon rosae TaxID=946125 RepID=A0AAD9WC74_9HELO|nr:hypothetical protein QTJ16_004409 [Diplocarpon rosae]
MQSPRDILGCSLIAAAWISGNCGLEMMFWPEEDELKLGEAVTTCWTMVQDSEQSAGFEAHMLERLVARKMRDYVGDRRSDLLRRIRENVGNAFCSHPDVLNPETRESFWKMMAQDHAILSPDPREPGVKKWTSDILVKCLTLLYQVKGHWAQCSHSDVLSWFNPLSGTTMVIIATMIMLACREQGQGAKSVPTSIENDAPLFNSVRDSWNRMAFERRQVILIGVAKKMDKVLVGRLIATHEKPIETPYDGNLDDLLDDPDFAGLPGSSIQELAQKMRRQNMPLRKVQGHIDQDDEPSSKEDQSTFQSELESDSFDMEDADCFDDNLNDRIELPKLKQSEPQLEKQAPIHQRKRKVATRLQSSKMASISERPISKKTRSAFESSTKCLEVQWVRSKESLELAHVFELKDTMSWPDLMETIGMDVTETIFAVSQAKWDKYQRSGDSFALCNEEDLQKLRERFRSDPTWKTVVLYDATGQWQHSPS